jgi:hypothetical protein
MPLTTITNHDKGCPEKRVSITCDDLAGYSTGKITENPHFLQEILTTFVSLMFVTRTVLAIISNPF